MGVGFGGLNNGWQNMRMTRRLAAWAAAGALVSAATSASAADYPPGFSDQVVTSGLVRPTAMAFAPDDNRIFVTEQGGTLRVIKNGVLFTTPFVSLTVDSSGERGLLGVAFDPAFASNKFVYVYHTVPGSPAHNRVTRFTAYGSRAVAGSGRVILDLNPLGGVYHNGGAIHFGPDGKLYVFVGENARGANAQSLTTRLGKVLRINKDGTIPTDNPTSFPGISGTTSGVNRAIWAVGLRNPFTAAFQRTTGKLFINDVGENTWEEINLGRRGANYGWPTAEGSSSNPNFTDPVHQYKHVPSGPYAACAIVGGVFYNPPIGPYPSSYVGKYFYGDVCGGWINYIDAANPGNGGSKFASNIGTPVDLQIGDGGMINYLTRQGQVRRIKYDG